MRKKLSKKQEDQKEDNNKVSNNKKEDKQDYNQEELLTKVKTDFFEESNLDKLTDEELVDLYKKGIKETLEILIKRYKNVILSKTLLFYLADGQEREDLLQEAYLGFLSAIKDFNKNKGSFYTFANVCIQRHIYTFVKSLNRNKNKILKGAVSLESTISKDQEFVDRRLEEYLMHSKISSNIPSANIYLSSDEIASVNLDYKEKREKIFKKLTPIEREILKYRSLGYSYKDIANKIGKSIKSVDNALQRIKRKVKLILED
ncbi:MAG: sigma-70 family RNA polymerase sigma factor [bacterium]|jgi:RNA polymerase sporulation-specific sigma factor